MQMTIDCPKCGTPLLVPESAAGRKARCTSCDTRFIIPSAEEMLEMTVTHMVLDELDARRHENVYDQPDEDDKAKAKPEPSLKDEPAASKAESFAASASGTIVGVPVQDTGGDQSGVLSIDEIHQNVSDEVRLDGGDSDGFDSAILKAMDERAEDASDDTGYPQEVNPAEPRPYLVVRDISVNGVLIAFDARWLRHEVFRCSMPIRCAYSGHGPDKTLAARPMVFTNRTTTGETQARSLELKYETEDIKKHTPRELVRKIGRMNDLIPPFDNPMLYYVVAGRPFDAMHCRVNDRQGDVCEVLVPSGQVAVQWIERVNGRCGPEYAKLKADVAHLSSDAWTQLPPKVRERLEPWTKFQSGEKFLLYLNDPDFSSSDAGLAGIVITDKRLIYHKYRRLRSISLNQDAVLHIRPDGRVVRLTLESAGRMARAGKIQRADMNQVIDVLTNSRLRLMVGQG